MKRLVIFLLALLAFVSITVYAHPGRTDGSGGHTNHSTGEYHYHHGYSEHQHYDMDGDGIADCPYGFKANTAKVNKDKYSSSNKNSTSFTDEYNEVRKQQSDSEVKDADISKNTEQKTKRTPKEIIGIVLEVIFLGPIVLLWALSIISAVLSVLCDFIQKLKKK